MSNEKKLISSSYGLTRDSDTTNESANINSMSTPNHYLVLVTAAFVSFESIGGLWFLLAISTHTSEKSVFIRFSSSLY